MSNDLKTQREKSTYTNDAPTIEGWAVVGNEMRHTERRITYRHERGHTASVSILPFTEEELEASGYTREQWAQWPWDVAVYGDNPIYDEGCRIDGGYGKPEYVESVIRRALQQYLEAFPGVPGVVYSAAESKDGPNSSFLLMRENFELPSQEENENEGAHECTYLGLVMVWRMTAASYDGPTPPPCANCGKAPTHVMNVGYLENLRVFLCEPCVSLARHNPCITHATRSGSN